MDKISNAQIAEVLSDAASTLRSQQAHISDLEEKLAARDLNDRSAKIASEMHRKGLELDVDVNELASRLEKVGEEKLATIEQAVDLVGPDMGSKIASINHDGGHTSDSSNLERFILGDAG